MATSLSPYTRIGIVAETEQAARALSEKRSGGHLVRARRGDAAIYLVVPSA